MMGKGGKEGGEGRNEDGIGLSVGRREGRGELRVLERG